MSNILSYIKANPQETQRLMGLHYERLQQLIEKTKRLHNEKQAS
ncbi:MAG: hypothetical protein N4J56_003259 [Chroococcidiopsis sp. SAG 2025]|nr:hypothetical protein [Chroococcidiopsis sp. SAG 2025]